VHTARALRNGGRAGRASRQTHRLERADQVVRRLLRRHELLIRGARAVARGEGPFSCRWAFAAMPVGSVGWGLDSSSSLATRALFVVLGGGASGSLTFRHKEIAVLVDDHDRGGLPWRATPSTFGASVKTRGHSGTFAQCPGVLTCSRPNLEGLLPGFNRLQHTVGPAAGSGHENAPQLGGIVRMSPSLGACRGRQLKVFPGLLAGRAAGPSAGTDRHCTESSSARRSPVTATESRRGGVNDPQTTEPAFRRARFVGHDPKRATPWTEYH